MEFHISCAGTIIDNFAKTQTVTLQPVIEVFENTLLDWDIGV